MNSFSNYIQDKKYLIDFFILFNTLEKSFLLFFNLLQNKVS